MTWTKCAGELEARPEEDRNITVVCLGKELAADARIEDWNRLRKGDKAVNRIELCTDPRAGDAPVPRGRL